jgi:glutaredoxin-like protein
MIPLEEQRTLRELFQEQLREPVKIDFFTQKKTALMLPGREECQFCDDVQTLLQEIVHLDERLTLTVHDFGADTALAKRYGVERVPATVLRGVINRPVVFFGVPLAELFNALIESLVLVSHNHSHLPPAAAKRVKHLREPVNLRLFVSLTSPQAAAMMIVATAFALKTKLVKTSIVEASEFPRLTERLGIKEVPYALLNDRYSFVGMVEPEPFAAQLIKAVTSRTLAAQTPRLGETTPLAPAGSREGQQVAENVRPSGLIIPGR